MLGDTIAAVSTPHGRGGVAMIRVSGPDAIEICDRMFCAKNKKGLAQQTARMAVFGDIYAVENGLRESIDDGIATVFRAPASFTGEDTVEICCHGGALLTQTVLTSILSCGARPAEAGEFTRRAFLNGKIGLSSAEALGNILEARTRDQITLAHVGMGGRIEARCGEIYDRIRHVLASIYARIDYPDEDLADMSREEMAEAIHQCLDQARALCSSYRTGHAIAEGIATVICGKPNVGKSSLYNQLVGRDAAIVTDIEGTTRDVLTETATVGRVMLRLFDTAGLRETDNPVERIGIDRTRSTLAEAELVLAVFDASLPLSAEDRELLELLKESNACVIAVLNKSDVDGADRFSEELGFAHTVSISARTGEGIDRLAKLIDQLFTDDRINLREDAVLTNARQHAAAIQASDALFHALEALECGLPVELACTDAELAMTAIGELDGREVSEDIVSEIFAHFCVGK